MSEIDFKMSMHGTELKMIKKKKNQKSYKNLKEKGTDDELQLVDLASQWTCQPGLQSEILSYKKIQQERNITRYEL